LSDGPGSGRWANVLLISFCSVAMIILALVFVSATSDNSDVKDRSDRAGKALPADGKARPDPTPDAFSDDFETGDFSKWSQVTNNGDGVASVASGAGVGGSFGARFVETANVDSAAYARYKLRSPAPELTMSASIRYEAAGVGDYSTAFMRLFDSDGARLVTLQRRNGNGRLQLSYGSTTVNLSTIVPAGDPFLAVKVRLIVGAAKASTIQVWVDGVIVQQVTNATISGPTASVTIGNDSRRQASTVDVDDVLVARPAS